MTLSQSITFEELLKLWMDTQAELDISEARVRDRDDLIAAMRKSQGERVQQFEETIRNLKAHPPRRKEHEGLALFLVIVLSAALVVAAVLGLR